MKLSLRIEEPAAQSRTSYFCWLFPTAGEPVRIGPYASKWLVCNRCKKAILKEIEQGIVSARDLRLLDELERRTATELIDE